MSLHVIVLEIRQLLHVAIESDRQTATGIDATEDDLCQSLTAGLSAVPSLHDGIGSLLFWNESDGAAGAIGEDDTLASLMQSVENIALRFRQFYHGAVAALEALFLDIHLLALKVW